MLNDLADAIGSYAIVGVMYASWCVLAWERDMRWLRRRGQVPLMRAAVMLAIFAWPAYLLRRGASRYEDPDTTALPLRRHQPDYDKIADLERELGMLTRRLASLTTVR